MVYKTFVSKELVRDDQDEITNESKRKLKKEIEEMLNEDSFDKNDFIYKTDVIKGLE